MSSRPRSDVNSTILIVTLIAGLACGVVIAVFLSRPAEEAPPEDIPVLESQRMPWDMLHPEDATAPAVGVGGDPGAAPPQDGAAPPAEPDTADQRVIAEARRRSEAAGVTEYVELTEELFIRLSAKIIIMATALSDHPDARSLLVDYEAQLLADERVDPDEWYHRAIQIARDPKRAKEMGEKIVREARRHTDMKIDVDDIPGLAPMPIAQPEPAPAP